MEPRRLLPIVSGLTVAAAILTGVWVLDRSETNYTLERQRARVADQVTGVRAKLEAALNGRLYLVRGLAAFVKTRAEISETEFNAFARELQDRQQGIRSLQLAPDAVVTYIYPFKGNEAAKGHNLIADPARREAVERAIAGRQFIVAGPVQLRQGGVALIGRLPIFLPAPSGAPGEDRFWGFSIILIDLEPLLEEGGVFDQLSGVRFALRGIDGLGAGGAVFFGDEAIFDADPIAFDVTLPNGSWQLVAIPKGGWSSSWRGREWLLGGGGALALLAGVLIFVLLKRPAQLRQAVRKATSALRESDALNATILDTAADAIITIDGRGIVQSFNRTAEGMFGYTADEVIGRNVKMLMAEPYHDEHDGYLANYLNTGEKKIIGIGREVEGRRKDGTRFPMDLALGEARLGEGRLFTGVMRDITKRKRAKEALRESEEQVRMLMNSTAEAIYGVDLEGNCTFANPACAEMLGYDRAEDLLGKHMHDLIHHTRPDGTRYPVEECLIYLAFRRGQGTHVEDEVLWRRDGSSFPVDYWSYPVRRDGEVVGAVVTFLDITERKKAEAALREAHDLLELRVRERTAELGRAKEQAEHANRAKSDFLATMSHELRTPLNAILGFSEVTKDETFGPVGSVKYREYAEDIHKSGQHLLDLINDILDLSKVESGTGELLEEDIEIPEVVRSVMMLVSGRAQQGGVELETIVPDDLRELHADQRKLKQILVNLLSNAIKFTPAGGKVALRTWSRAESGFVFQIIDTGIGIALEDIPKALAPFQQIDSDLNRKYEGTGLGLPLAKALVELHGGSLDLQSELGVGTKVTVRFPAERVANVLTRTTCPPAA